MPNRPSTFLLTIVSLCVLESKYTLSQKYSESPYMYTRTYMYIYLQYSICHRTRHIHYTVYTVILYRCICSNRDRLSFYFFCGEILIILGTASVAVNYCKLCWVPPLFIQSGKKCWAKSSRCFLAKKSTNFQAFLLPFCLWQIRLNGVFSSNLRREKKCLEL